MTVRELVETLDNCDPDAEVQIRSVEDGLVVQTSDLTEIRDEGPVSTVILIGELS